MPKKYSKFRQRLELYAVAFVLWCLSILPLKSSMKLGKRIGGVISSRLGKLNRTAYRNLAIAMPDNDAETNRQIVSGTFESLGRHLGFISHFRHFEREDVRELVDVVGKEHFDRARATGKGLIFFTGHFGSWEVFNLLPPAFDEHINILVRRIDNPLVEAYVDRMRTKFGSVTLGKREAPRKIYQLLEQGEIVGILADLNAQLHDGVFVDFFGVPACTTKSIAKFALRSDANIIPVFAVWEEDRQKYVVYLEPPIEFETTGDKESDILAISQAFTSVVEKYVKRYPEQWLWIHKRWNTRPRGEKGLY